jgi:hypothetical protein
MTGPNTSYSAGGGDGGSDTPDDVSSHKPLHLTQKTNSVRGSEEYEEG